MGIVDLFVPKIEWPEELFKVRGTNPKKWMIGNLILGVVAIIAAIYSLMAGLPTAAPIVAAIAALYFFASAFGYWHDIGTLAKIHEKEAGQAAELYRRAKAKGIYDLETEKEAAKIWAIAQEMGIEKTAIAMDLFRQGKTMEETGEEAPEYVPIVKKEPEPVEAEIIEAEEEKEPKNKLDHFDPSKPFELKKIGSNRD